MIGITFCVLSIFHIALSDPVPPHCRGPPPGVTNPRECCKFEKVFSEEDLKSCGIEKPTENERQREMPDCSKQVCILNKFNLMKDDDTVDKEAVATFLDKYAEKNTDYKTAVEAAKDRCLKDDLPGPPEICEANKIVFCIVGTVFMNCPKWEDTDNCNKLKNHVEECQKYIK